MKRVMKVLGPLCVFGLAVVAGLVSAPESWSALSMRVMMGETGTVGCGICCKKSEGGSPSAALGSPGGQANSDDDYCTRSLAPVNYHTGENLYNTTDLSVSSFNGMSISRHYVATQGYEDKDMLGPGWRFWDPRLLDTGTQKLFVDGSRHSRSWTKAGVGVYTPDFFSTDMLKDGANAHLSRDPDGAGMTFYSNDYTFDANLRGRPFAAVSSSTVDGASTTSTYVQWIYNASVAGTYLRGQISSKEDRSYVNGAVDPNNKTLFVYVLSDLGGTIGPRITEITTYRLVAGVQTLFRKLTLAYYLASTTNGPAGTLKQVDLKDAASAIIESKYYRYNNSTFNAGTNQVELSYVVEGPSYERLKAVSPSNDVNQASPAQMDLYANYKFGYDAGFRCTSEVVQGQGGAITFQSEPRGGPFTEGINSWSRSTVETFPDGTQNLIYTNFRGQAIMKSFLSVGSEWRTWFLRDAQGRVIQKASAEAVTGYNTGYDNLMDGDGGNVLYLDDSNGLVEITNYASTTTATTAVAGNVAGYITSRQVKKGENGVPDTLESYTYIQHNSNNGGFVTSVYPIASKTVYEGAAGASPRTTTYNYT